MSEGRESDGLTAGRGAVPLAVPFYYGWVIVALSFLVTFAAAGTRAAPAVLIQPLEAEFGWSRGGIASAASLNLLLLGVGAPVAGWLLDSFGLRRVVLSCLGLLALGVGGTIFMQELWQLILLWGVIAGLGTGTTPVLAAFVANRWFVARRGLALGILANGNAAGQMVFLPVLMAVIVAAGWRGSSVLMVTFVLVLMLLVVLWMRDDPSDVGLEPYGAVDRTFAQPGLSSVGSIASEPVGDSPVRDAFRSPTFWLLSGCFFVCGVTANGLIGTHLIPHVIERGIPKVTAAATVGVMGGFSFVGTLFAGWLVDRIDPRKVLAVVYALRGSSLFILPHVDDFYGLLVFAVIYGLDWYASGPGTIAIAADAFGRRAVGQIFGWVFLSHQLGAACAAVAGGAIYMHFGEYNYAFVGGGIMGWIAAALALRIRLKRQGQP